MQWTKLLLLPIPSSSSTFQSGASSKLRFLSTSIAATFGIPYLKNTYCFCQRPSLANWCPTSLADLFTCIKHILNANTQATVSAAKGERILSVKVGARVAKWLGK
ncbi:hypothetical protein F383_03796 [Gossypium arboreum]|uniref:Uncharacterized protein n=1 Tax=Gossypium arboreum TaxID=29729 RepID=A0A0B0NJZ9_GOSAR|nr:hypothetical protein F383_03796 [Gossypium arboreum]